MLPETSKKKETRVVEEENMILHQQDNAPAQHIILIMINTVTTNTVSHFNYLIVI